MEGSRSGSRAGGSQSREDLEEVEKSTKENVDEDDGKIDEVDGVEEEATEDKVCLSIDGLWMPTYKVCDFYDA